MVHPRRFKPAGILLAGLLIAGFGACAPRQLMLDEMVVTLEAGLPAFEQEGDLAMLESALPANIKLLEALRISRPANPRLLVLLSRMHAARTFAFAEQRLEAAMLGAGPGTDGQRTVASFREPLNRYYLKGAGYALDALEVRHPDVRQQVGHVATVEGFLKGLKTDDVPALFWYGFNLGAYVNQNRDAIPAIARAHLAEKAMLRVIALDETYFHGSAHLFLMVFYASRSPMLGGSPEKARDHYRRLKALAGENFLLADVYHARYVLYRAQDRRAYEAALQRVMAQPVDKGASPFLNAVAVRRAAIYLNAADRLFD